MNTLITMIIQDVARTPVSETGFRFWSGNIHQDMLMATIVVVMVTVLVAALVLLKAFKTIVRLSMPEIEQEVKAAAIAKKEAQKESRRAWWNKLMGLRPLADEEELVIDHAYDGIKELDNPTPVWFMGLFYATMVFGVVYLSVYYVFGIGLSQDEEYQQEMTIAEQQRKAYLATQANNVDENTVAIDNSAETLAAGKSIFQQNCVACHGGAGEGGIGPNLTDDYWLHGGNIKNVFKTITHGVPDKGMVAWGQQLSPAQIAQVANFVLSIHGTNPPNAKAPQGELEAAQADGDAVAASGIEKEEI